MQRKPWTISTVGYLDDGSTSAEPTLPASKKRTSGPGGGLKNRTSGHVEKAPGSRGDGAVKAMASGPCLFCLVCPASYRAPDFVRRRRSPLSSPPSPGRFCRAATTLLHGRRPRAEEPAAAAVGGRGTWRVRELPFIASTVYSMPLYPLEDAFRCARAAPVGRRAAA